MLFVNHIGLTCMKEYIFQITPQIYLSSSFPIIEINLIIIFKIRKSWTHASFFTYCLASETPIAVNRLLSVCASLWEMIMGEHFQ